MAPASAAAGSASAKTMLGDLPPSSRSTRVMRGATASRMRAPTAELPVNEIMSTSGAGEAHRDRPHLRRLGDRADGARLGDGEIDQPGRLAPEALRRLDEARGALGAAHGAPRAALEGRARGPRRGAHLLDRALRRVAGELLGRRVDHRVRPPRGAHPLAADQDLVDDGDAHAAFALSAASRWRVVRCIGSWSNFGSTCLPKVSIDSRTYFWSRVRVKGA